MGKKKIKLEGVTLVGLYSGFKGTEDYDVKLGTQKFKRAFDVCTHYCDFEDVKMITHSSINVTGYQNIAKLPKISSRVEGSKWIIKELYKHIDTKHMLLIHSDGFILNPDAWDDAFLEYDYVAAPSPWEEYSCVNGGFCLRSRALMEYVATHPHDWFHPEDFVIACERREELESAGFKFAPRELAEKFSHEKNARYFQGWDGEFGFHDVTKTDITKWEEPEFFKFDWDEWALQIKAPSIHQKPYPPTREAHIYD